MIHLKKFENLIKNEDNIEYWILYNGDYFEIHPTKESAENSLINSVNDNIKNFEMDVEDDDYITEYDDALRWHKELFDNDIIIGIEKGKFYSKPEQLDKKIERLRQIKKYNL